MKKKIKIIVIITLSSLCVLLIVSYIIGINNNPYKKLSAPESDIIFQSYMYAPFEISFVQSDGSGYQVVKIPDNFVKLKWSSDGEMIYGLHNPYGQPKYENLGYPAYWNLSTNEFKDCYRFYQKQIEEYEHSEIKNEVLIYNSTEIVLYDMETCQNIRKIVDYNDTSPRRYIAGISYHKESQEFVYSEIWDAYTSNRSYHIFKLDLQSKEKEELAEGINPSFSPDGKKIAYLGIDGLYVMDINGREQTKIVSTQLFEPWSGGSPWTGTPEPRWSPDGEWIVFHQCEGEYCHGDEGIINKVRVSDGTIERIYTGGLFPSWKP